MSEGLQVICWVSIGLNIVLIVALVAQRMVIEKLTGEITRLHGEVAERAYGRN